MKDTYISLGSNQGDSLQNLELAKKYILEREGIHPGPCSSIYYTEPQGVKEQSWFANQVIRIGSDHTWEPANLLKELLRIEDDMGRVRIQRFGPRIIDLDLLLFGNKEVETKDLTLPHPRMHQRAFVLVPILEIEPELELPSGQKLGNFLDDIDFRVSGDRIWQA